MRSKVGIEKLKVMTIIGVNPDERQEKQPLLIDISVETDISKCVASDTLMDTLDYASLKSLCEEVAENQSFRLIESFAAAILKTLQLKFPLAHIGIKVTKPKALKDAFAFVEIEHSP